MLPAADPYSRCPLLPPADKEEDELIQMRRTIARLEEEEALLVREMSAALLELGTQVQLDIEMIRIDYRYHLSRSVDLSGAAAT